MGGCAALAPRGRVAPYARGVGLSPCSGKRRLRMKRILSLVVVALVVAGMVLLMAMTALADGKDNNATGAKCSEATLEGRYLFSFDGYAIQGIKRSRSPRQATRSMT